MFKFNNVKNTYVPQQSEISPNYASLAQHSKISIAIYHINKLKKENHTIISIDQEKAI